MRPRFVKLVMLLAVFCWNTPGISAQDFLLQGCYWSCPEEMDSASYANWHNRLRTQAPELAYAGFSYIWLPAVADSLNADIPGLVSALRKAGLEAVIDVTVPKTGNIFQPIEKSLRDDAQIKGFRMKTAGVPDPLVAANFLNARQKLGNPPDLVFADIPGWEDPTQLANWVAKVTQHLTPDTKLDISTRVYDYVLREALRQACDDAAYDVREVYDQSLRDLTALTGFNVVTLANCVRFNNQNGESGDSDDPIADPLLAYAYLLTNNQVGLPAVYYDDYFGRNGRKSLRKEIDQLIRVHQQYIYNSTAIEYLNQPESERASIYLSATDGADASKTLIFQLDGMNTPAATDAERSRDVIVAINFADAPLRLIQEINMSNVELGDTFTDVLGNSGHGSAEILNDGQYDIPNAIYVELPPRSYSVWVRGDAERVATGAFDLHAEAFDTYTELSWEIPAGRNNISYEIERSINQGKFEPIAKMEALGEDETGAAYLYVDEKRLHDDEVFYRVKSVNTAGLESYSSVASIKPFIREMGFEVLNCDKRGMKTIKVRSNVESDGQLAVFNAAGERIMSRAMRIRNGVTQVTLDLSLLPKGVYFVQFSTNQKKEWMKKVVNL